MVYKWFVFLLFVLIAWLPGLTFSQEYTFDKISIDQGLSQNSVYCILKDSKGFMWFGTEDGLNRYNAYTFKVYNTSRDNKFSINSNYAYAICEMDTGIFLVGTEKGISIFESGLDKFTNVFVEKTGNFSVSKIYKDKQNNIWVCTFGKGVLFFAKTTNQLNAIASGSFDRLFLSNEIVYDVVSTPGGTIWLACQNGLKKLNDFGEDGESVSEQAFAGKKIRSLLFDASNRLWVGTETGLYLYNPSLQQASLYTFAGIEATTGWHIIKSICSDTKDNLWIGTDDGLIVLNLETGNYSISKNSIYNPEGLSQGIIQAIYTDNSGIVWIGTDAGGVNIYNEKNRKFFTIRPVSNRDNWLSNKIVYGFTEDANGLIYIATYGGGLNIFNPKTRSFRVLHAQTGKSNALQSNYIYCLATGMDGIIWVGTRDAGLQSFNPKTSEFRQFKHSPTNNKSLSHNAVRSVFVDSSNRVWVGTYGGGLNLLYPETCRIQRFAEINPIDNKEKGNIIYSVFQDKAGIIWIGTRGGGLKKINIQTGELKAYINHADDSASLSNNFAFPVYEDSKDRLWVGTLGGGLNLFDRERESFKTYTTENGLSNNVIYTILEDKSGNLWLSTAKGISSFSPDKMTCKRYYESDGLQSSEFNGGSAFKSKDGYMFFGGINGFSFFYPDSIFINREIPPVIITGLKVMNKEIVPSRDGILKRSIQDTREIKLKYSDNILNFEFSALNYTHSDLNQYACKMEGFDNHWNQLGNQRTVNYTNLDPGVYTFKVIASNNDGIWNEAGAELIIEIEPPYYKTWWFRILLVVLSGFVIFFYIKRREYTLRDEKDKLELAVKERTREIQMQKEEIATQRDEIQKQAIHLQEANKIIDQKNKNITDSIKYASYIQNAVLPAKDAFLEVFPQSFILYQPKDFVSGDFYWVKNSPEKFILAAADCTGHGVPGAMMSMMGISLLNEIVNFQSKTDPSEILEDLRFKIKFALQQSGSFTEMREGIEMGLFVYDKTSRMANFAGANIPLILIRNGKLTEFEPDYQPAGVALNEKSFTNHRILPDKSDVFYLMSDGYISQFGGEKGQQFRKKRLTDLLLQVHNEPFETQKQILEKEMTQWKGNREQIDDLLIIGFKL